jgi:guanosine-3',5'-bis(diphosphate) 3'-pyrophosphohydrolase
MYGENPYTYHLGKVVEVLERFKVTDPDILAAGWLHDILEDTPTTVEDLWDEFGFSVSALVDAVTDGEGGSRKERKARPYALIPRIPGAIFLKLADRIANLEASLDEGHDRLRKMYTKEHPGFREALYDGETALKMWEHLDRIFDPVGVR